MGDILTIVISITEKFFILFNYINKQWVERLGGVNPNFPVKQIRWWLLKKILIWFNTLTVPEIPMELGVER